MIVAVSMKHTHDSGEKNERFISTTCIRTADVAVGGREGWSADIKLLSHHAPLINEYLIEKEKQPQAKAQNTEHPIIWHQ